MNFNLKYIIETNINFDTKNIKEFQTKLEIKSFRIEMKLQFIINCYCRVKLKQIKILIPNILGISIQSVN